MNDLAAAASTSRRRWTVAALVAVGMLVAGCGSATGDAGDPASSRRPSGKPTTPRATSEPSTTPPTSAPPPSLPTPTASDGTRYAACADGTCEVAVSRPVDISVNGGTFSVTKVKPGNSLDFELTLASGGGGSGTLKGTCGTIARFSPGPVSMLTCSDADATPTPPAPEPGALSVQLAGWDRGDAAVLRLVSG